MHQRISGTCRHCRIPVIRDDEGCWVHTSLSYVCRDRWGSLLPTYAAAVPPPPVPPTPTPSRGTTRTTGAARGVAKVAQVTRAIQV